MLRSCQPDSPCLAWPQVQERNLRAALEVSTLHIVALSGDDDAEVVEEVERQVRALTARWPCYACSVPFAPRWQL